MSYYGYKQNEGVNATDWAKSTKQLVDELQRAYDDREKRKDEVEKAQQEMTQTISDHPSSEHAGIQEFGIDAQQNYSKANLELHKMFKSGLIEERDFLIRRENLKQGVEDIYGIVQDLDKEYAKKMELHGKGELSAVDAWTMSRIEGLMKFSETGVVIDPKNYRSSLAKKVKNKDGVYVVSKNPDDVMSINHVRGHLKSVNKKFDLDGAADKAADNLGTHVKAVMRGGVKSIEDATQNKGFQDMMNTTLDSLLTNPMNAVSILTDHGDGRYNFTTDPKAQGGDNILMTQDPSSGQFVPALTPEQEEEAREILRKQIVGRIDYKEEARPDRPIYQWQVNRADDQRTDEQVANIVADLFRGTEAEKKAAAASLRGLDDNLLGISFDKNNKTLVIKARNSQGAVVTERIPMDGTLEDFMKASTLLHGIADASEVLNTVENYNPNATLSDAPLDYNVDEVSQGFDKTYISTTIDGKTGLYDLRTYMANSKGRNYSNKSRAEYYGGVIESVLQQLPAHIRNTLTVTPDDSGGVTITSTNGYTETIDVSRGRNDMQGMISATAKVFNDLAGAGGSSDNLDP